MTIPETGNATPPDIGDALALGHGELERGSFAAAGTAEDTSPTDFELFRLGKRVFGPRAVELRGLQDLPHRGHAGRKITLEALHRGRVRGTVFDYTR